jgi:hypothetical protein
MMDDVQDSVNIETFAFDQMRDMMAMEINVYRTVAPKSGGGEKRSRMS